MAGLLGNVGIKGSQAGTTLKAMLNKMAAPTKEAQELFQKLGVTVKDSAGNLRSPVAVLGEMAEGSRPWARRTDRRHEDDSGRRGHRRIFGAYQAGGHRGHSRVRQAA